MKKPQTGQRQLALFHADTRFVLLVTSLFTSGLAATLGPSAVVVFLVLRANANFNSGKIFLGQRLIATQAGISLPTTRKALALLEQHGLISRSQERDNSRTTYRITDRIPIFTNDEARENAGTLLVPFMPTKTAEQLAAARESLRYGDAPPAETRVVINLTLVQHIGSGDVVVHNGTGSSSTSKTLATKDLPAEAQAFFTRMMTAKTGEEPS